MKKRQAGDGSTSHECQGPQTTPGARTEAWDVFSLGASRRNQPG